MGTHWEPRGSYKDCFKLKTFDIQQTQEGALSHLPLSDPKQKLLRDEVGGESDLQGISFPRERPSVNPP